MISRPTRKVGLICFGHERSWSLAKADDLRVEFFYSYVGHAAGSLSFSCWGQVGRRSISVSSDFKNHVPGFTREQAGSRVDNFKKICKVSECHYHGYARSTRANRMGFGSDKGYDAAIGRSSEGGRGVHAAYSQIPLDPPSHATILTGTYPQYNHVDDFGSRLGKDIGYLPDILARAGLPDRSFRLLSYSGPDCRIWRRALNAGLTFMTLDFIIANPVRSLQVNQTSR